MRSRRIRDVAVQASRRSVSEPAGTSDELSLPEGRTKVSAQPEASSGKSTERLSPRVVVKAILTDTLSPQQARELVEKHLPIESR